MEQRIKELELGYMHQEKTIEELNQIVCQQELSVEQLKREIIILKEQFRQVSPAISRDFDQEKPPPHY
jgi:SlyX protein